MVRLDVPVQERGGDKPGGVFVRGGVVGADLRSEITRLLLEAGPAADCAAPSGRFAVLSAAEGTNVTQVQVELDGCRRVLVQGGLTDELLAQAGPELAGLLDRD